MSVPQFLYVTPVLPWPANQGSRSFLLQTARTLKSLGDVHWATLEIGDQSEARAKLEAEGFHLHLDRSHLSRTPLARLSRRISIDTRALRWRRPRELAMHSSPSLSAIVRILYAAHPDSIGIAAFWNTWKTLEALPPERRVLILSDVESDRLAGAAAFGLADESAVAQLRAAELEAMQSAGYLFALSEYDCGLANGMLGESGNRCRPWPIGFPPRKAAVTAVDRPRSGAFRLLTVGHWGADFNRDGLLDWLRRVWPGVRDASPARELRVAGTGLDAALSKELQEAGAVVLGWVASLEEEYELADAVLVSLRFAGGVRYRLLEAMAAGKACVSNRVACRGLPVQDGTQLLIAEEAWEWEAAVRELEEKRRAEELGLHAREFMQSNFDMASQAERAKLALERLLDDVQKESR